MALKKIKSYVSNAQKELGELLEASQNYRNVKGDKTLDELKKRKKFQNERGQWVGAVLQGRRYNSSGTQITGNSRSSGGISGKGSKNVNPTYNTY